MWLDEEPILAFPHVRLYRESRAVEFDGVVPIDVNDPDAPDVWLEVTVCVPDSKEHESLVMTEARPSHVHAALLMLGVEPGRPGFWDVSEAGELLKFEPRGPAVRVEFITRGKGGGAGDVIADAAEWVLVVDGARLERRRVLRDVVEGEAFVFGGSRIVERMGREWYEADMVGTLVGLSTFGSETVAHVEVHSHASAVEAPRFLARSEVVPPQWTEVTVRLTVGPAEESVEGSVSGD